jgi:hypothetical protein
MTLAPDDFVEIVKELERQPIEVTKYRLKSGIGRSQVFGVVNRRSVHPDYSRHCWKRPYLFKLILDFAEKHVKIPWNACTLNQDYKAAAHRDKGNIGDSFLVAFGDYIGGELEIHEGPLKGLHNVKYNPLVTDFSKVLHEVKDFLGHRYSLVFYKLDIQKRFKDTIIPPCSVVYHESKWLFKRGDTIVTDGLDHPLKGRTKIQMQIVEGPVILKFD